MKALDTIIVDDEILARVALERLCKDVREINVVGSYDNARDAFQTIKKKEIDLMFLDVEMPEVSGIEFLEQLTYSPQVVISSSKKDYAYDAFEYDVTDYLIKPINKARFRKSIERVKNRNSSLHNLSEYSAQNEIYIKSEGKYVRLAYADINYFENVGDYIKIVSDKSTIITYGTIKGIEQKIQYPRLVKVHRSFIINLDKISDIKGNTVVIAKKVIPISRSNRYILMQRLNIL